MAKHVGTSRERDGLKRTSAREFFITQNFFKLSLQLNNELLVKNVRQIGVTDLVIGKYSDFQIRTRNSA